MAQNDPKSSSEDFLKNQQPDVHTETGRVEKSGVIYVPNGFNTSPIWPACYQSAVGVAFDLDGPTGDAMLNGSLLHHPYYFTEAAYGPWRALPRLLDLLDKYAFRATFFIPAWIVQHWPLQCRDIVDSGHEVAYHGYQHECFIDLPVERQYEVMARSRTIFETELGVIPQGFRTPSGDWSHETADILTDFGVAYSSSMRGDDRPYFHYRSDGRRGLIEIPARWDIDDYTALAYFEDPDFPNGQDRIASYQMVARNWCHEFEGFHQEGLCWATILHPKVSGKPGRLFILDTLFATISEQKNAWVATCGEIARWWQFSHSENSDAPMQDPAS